MTFEVYISQRDGAVPISSVVATGIVAQPGGQADATPLTARKNIVTNCVPGAAVILQVLSFPDEMVFNRCGTGQALAVLPPVGMKIEGLGPNVPATIADGDAATFTWDGMITWLVS